eukprot:scaffold1.g5222.t1
MDRVLLPPSPNWFGAHLADLAPAHGLYAYAGQNSVVLVDTSSYAVQAVLPAHFQRVTALAFARLADGQLALVTGAADRMLRLWSVQARKCLRTLSKRPADASAIATAGGGGTALVGDRTGGLFAWDLASTKAARLSGASRQGVGVTALAPGPSAASAGLVAVGWADGWVTVVDWRRDAVVQRLRGHRGDVHSVRWAAFPSSTAQQHRGPALLETASMLVPAPRVAPDAGAVCTPDSTQAADAAPAAADQAPPPADEAAALSMPVELRSAHAAEEEPPAQATEEVPPPPPPEPSTLAAGQAAADSPDPCPASGTPASPEQQQECAAVPPLELLVSGGVDCSLHLYSITAQVVAAEAVAEETEAPMAAADAAADGVSSSSASGHGHVQVAAKEVCNLYVPKPQGGMSQTQQARLWLTTAWVPGASSAGGQPPQHAWLLTSGYGGSMLAWHVPLPAARGAGAAPRAAPPVRLPHSHARPVFAIHAAVVPAPCGAGGGSQPQLQVLTISMDRLAKAVQLPLPGPGAAAEAASASWREGKEAAAGWKKAATVMSIAGLGGFAYALCAQPPPAARVQRPGVEEAAEAEQQPGEVQDTEADQWGPTEDAEAEQEPGAEQRPEAEQEAGAEQGSEQAEQVPPAAGQQQRQQQEQGGQLLLALACGDKTVRVLPVAREQPQHAAQAVLWGGLTANPTALAWLPELSGPSPAAASPGGGADADAKLSRLLAFGCKDGAVGIMATQRNQSALLPVKHKGALVELRWAMAAVAGAGEDRVPALVLWSLSVDGTLLQWGPWPDVADLLPAGKAGGGGAVASPASRQHMQPTDLGAALAAASGAEPGEMQITALDAPAPAVPAPTAAEVPSVEQQQPLHLPQQLLVVGCDDGSVAVYARPPAGGAWQEAWAHRPGSAGAPAPAAAHVRLSPDARALAWADEGSGLWACALGPHAAGDGIPARHALPALCTALRWAPLAVGAPAVGGLLAAALTNNTVHILAYWHGELVAVQRLKGHTGVVRALCWLGPQLLLSGAEDQSVRSWRVEAGGDIAAAVAAARAAEAQAAEARAAAAAVAAVAEAQVAAAEAGATEAAVAEAVEAEAAATEARAAPVAAVPATPPQLAQEHPAAQVCNSAIPSADTGLEAEAEAEAASKPPESADDGTTVPESAVVAHAAAGTSSPVPAAAPAAVASPAAEAKRRAPPQLRTLGSRALLPPAGVGADDVGRQAAAQEAVLRLARLLLRPPKQHGARAPLEDMQVLDCAVDPLAASRLLQAAGAGVAAAAGSGAAHARHAAAQRAAALALWRGDLGQALDVLLQHEALTAEFVSLAAGAGALAGGGGGGPPAWRAATRLHAAALEEQQEPHLAALHLLALGEAEAAARAYQRAGLLREAVLLASVQLLPRESLLLELRRAHAGQLAGRTQHEQAAAQHAAAGRWAKAAAALLARGGRGAAHAAARLCAEVVAAVEAGALSLAAEEGAVLEQVVHQAAEQQLAAGAEGAAEPVAAAAQQAAEAPGPPAPEPPAPGPPAQAPPAPPRARYLPAALLAIQQEQGARGAAEWAQSLPPELAVPSGQPASPPRASAQREAGSGNGSARKRRYASEQLLELRAAASSAAAPPGLLPELALA